MSKSRLESRLESRVLRLARTYFDISRPLIEEMFDVELSQVEIRPFSEYKMYLEKKYPLVLSEEIKEHIHVYSKYRGFIEEGSKIFVNCEQMLEDEYTKAKNQELLEFSILDVITHEAMHAVHHKINSYLKLEPDSDTLNNESNEKNEIYIEGFATYFSLKIMLGSYEHMSNFQRAMAKNAGDLASRMQFFIGILYGDVKFYDFLVNMYKRLAKPEQNFQKSYIVEENCYIDGFRLFNELDFRLGLDGIKKAIRNPPASELHINYPKTYVEYLKKC